MSINNINNLQNVANSVNQVGSNAVSNNQDSNAFSARDLDLFNPDSGNKTLIEADALDPKVHFGQNPTLDHMAGVILNPVSSIL